MLIHRRSFLQRAGVLSTSLAVPITRSFAAQEPPSSPWRTFAVTTRVEVLQPAGVTRVWVPAALRRDTPFQRTLATTFHGPGGRVRTFQNEIEALELIAAEFPAGVAPVLTVTSHVRTRNWAVNWAAPKRVPQASASELQDCLQPTRLLPTDGIVKQRATQITQAARTELDKARAIYEWIIENTYRNPKTRGCGVGNIRFMLESGDLGGKCADLNALYVGLARAAGLPARDVYGLRIAASQKGYQSLGVSSENVTKAQHCRAEVYLSDYGWIPVDPADVRKVMLEELPGPRPLEDDKVKQARAGLFGSWEMNWMAYNYAQEVKLPGSGGSPIPFLMYPQAETAEGRLDSLDPDHFQYQIMAQEVTPAES